MTLDSTNFISKISPPLDQVLATSLVSEFLDLERRFVLGDWEPATLNGGQFAELASRIVYHVDSGNLNRTKGVDPCLKYVEDEKNSNSHAFPQRRASLHLCKALRTIYKFRSQRGAVHIDPDYTANELDSTLVLALARCVMSEILRIFWGGTTTEIAQTVREIVRYQVPAVLEIDGRPLVLRTDCTAEEEVLLLLHNSGERGLSRAEIGQAAMKSAPAVTTALKTLSAPKKREVVKRADGQIVLTPNGSKRVHDELADKLTLS